MSTGGGPMKSLFALGTSHRLADLDNVARARIPDSLLPEVLVRLAEKLEVSELVYLATCHRTEFYLVYEGELCPGRLTRALDSALAELTGGAASLPPSSHCLMLQGQPAAKHLFRVASALDSLMLGESQILGQVKDAFRQAVECGLAKAKLHTLFEQAFRAAKRVRTETKLSQSPTSLVSLAERVLAKTLAEDARPVAIVGAGEMAHQAVTLIRKLDQNREIVVANRSRERGEALARRAAGSFRNLSSLFQGPPGFSLIILATAAESPIVTVDLALRLAPTMFLDLGLPANVEAGVRGLPEVRLVNQEDLQEESQANREKRAAELAKAEAIVEEQLEELALELLEHELSPVARTLRDRFYELTRAELAQVFSNGHGSLPPELIDQLADRLSQRLIRAPLKGLRKVAFHHSPEVLSTFLSAVGQQ